MMARRFAPTYRVEVEPPVATAAQSAAYLPLERTPLCGFAPLVEPMKVQNQFPLSAYYTTNALNPNQGNEPSWAQVGGAAQLRPVMPLSQSNISELNRATH